MSTTAREKQGSIFTSCRKKFFIMYFSSNPTTNNAIWASLSNATRFFDKLLNKFMGICLFVQINDALGNPGVSVEVQIIASFRIVAYGKSFDEVEELFDISRSSSRKTFFAFFQAFCDEFLDQYLNFPNEQDLQLIFMINSSRGFPGCVDS